MSAFKPFTTADVILSPFKVNKSFSFQGIAELTGSGIDIFEGENTLPLAFNIASDSTGYIAPQDKFLVYRSIRELYYYNYLENSDGSPINTASFNDDGTITGLPYTPNAYNYLPNTLLADRYFPTGSGNIIGVVSIPSNKYGENLKPGTVTLSNGTSSLSDDGEGNLITGSLKVGDIIYSHGMIILTNDGIPQQDGYGYITYGTGSYGASDSTFIQSFINSTNISCSFDSTLTIYESQYKCTLRENEFNFSQNPTLISGSSNSGILYDFATGSYFTPYITSIGLYNNDKELLAIAKLSQPLRISDTTDTSIIINLDL
jgi:hypothetical protein